MWREDQGNKRDEKSSRRDEAEWEKLNRETGTERVKGHERTVQEMRGQDRTGQDRT